MTAFPGTPGYKTPVVNTEFEDQYHFKHNIGIVATGTHGSFICIGRGIEMSLRRSAVALLLMAAYECLTVTPAAGQVQVVQQQLGILSTEVRMAKGLALKHISAASETIC